MTPWLGIVHLTQQRGEEAHSLKGIAAAFCTDRDDYEASLRAAAEEGGYSLIWAEDVLPAGQWVARHPGDRDAVPLARAVHTHHRVSIGPLHALEAESESTAPKPALLRIDRIDNIAPLDHQPGIHPRKRLPDTVRDLLFDPPLGPGNDNTQDDAAAGPVQMHCYAVLDGAKMPYLLTGMLENSDMRYQSLFQGDTQEDLKEHAPYLVELAPENALVEKLFTGAEGVNGLWDKALGIFIRTEADFDDVRHHLRKFTRVQDENGKWYLFRFWEPGTLKYHLDGIASSGPRIAQFFAGRLPHPIHHFIVFDPDPACAYVYTPADKPAQSDRFISPLIGGEDQAQTLDPKYTEAFLRNAIGFLKQKTGFVPARDEDALLSYARDQIAALRTFGVATAPVTGLALGISLLADQPLTSLPKEQRSFLLKGDGSQYKRYHRLFQYHFEKTG